MDIDLTAHIKAEHIEEQAQALEKAYVAVYQRTVEIMLIGMRDILNHHPEVTYVSFDQDGDTDSVPIFFCLDGDGEDVADLLDDVTALSEQWNESRSPAAVDFLSLMEGKPLKRETLEEDLRHMCEILAENAPGPSKENKAWAESFLSHLHAMDMELAIPDPSGPRPAPRI